MILKFNIHSVVDLITNSSTTIYTYSEGSVPAVYELLNEIFKIAEISEKPEDVIYCKCFYNDYIYDDYKDAPEGFDFNKSIDDILENDTPEWMYDAEKYHEDRADYRSSSYIYIKAKDKKYDILISKIKKLIYSTDHESSFD